MPTNDPKQISCDTYDYVEVACLFRYELTLKLQDGSFINGIAKAPIVLPGKVEALRLESKNQYIDIVLSDIVTMEVATPNARFERVQFMTPKHAHYPIGTPGTPWGDTEKAQWLDQQKIKRSYKTQVIDKIEQIRENFSDVIVTQQYGALSINPDAFPLWLFKSKDWRPDKPTVLITGGVHGYETSGVQGALRFVESQIRAYSEHFKFIVAPCISPWAYETINRWNPNALDPNRAFHADSPSQEARSIMDYMKKLNTEIKAHLDLHETTDTDETEFRPAKSARDAIETTSWHIPDGFYTVGDSTRPAHEFQRAIIESVQAVTHIAPADQNNQIIGADIQQFGVINYSKRELGLCAGFTDAEYVTTTEVYPDSPRIDAEICILAQVAAVTGGLDFIKQAK